MFILRKIEGGRINVYEPQMLIAGGNINVGQALVFNADGNVEASKSATTTPTFIALADAKSGEEVACGRVESNQIYSTKKVTGTTPKKGAKCKMNGTVDGIDTSATGTVEVVAIEGNTAYIRFV